MKTVKQIALEVAHTITAPYISDESLTRFAERFLAAWLEQQSQEPVAWMGRDGEGFSYKESSYFTKPLFLAPPSAQGEQK